MVEPCRPSGQSGGIHCERVKTKKLNMFPRHVLMFWFQFRIFEKHDILRRPYGEHVLSIKPSRFQNHESKKEDRKIGRGLVLMPFHEKVGNSGLKLASWSNVFPEGNPKIWANAARKQPRSMAETIQNGRDQNKKTIHHLALRENLWTFDSTAEKTFGTQREPTSNCRNF